MLYSFCLAARPISVLLRYVTLFIYLITLIPAHSRVSAGRRVALATAADTAWLQGVMSTCFRSPRRRAVASVSTTCATERFFRRTPLKLHCSTFVTLPFLSSQKVRLDNFCFAAETKTNPDISFAGRFYFVLPSDVCRAMFSLSMLPLSDQSISVSFIWCCC